MAASLFGKPVETTENAGAADTLLAANVNRVGGFIVNNDDTDSVRLSFTDATCVNGFVLPPLGSVSLAGNQSAVYYEAVANTPEVYAVEFVG